MIAALDGVSSVRALLHLRPRATEEADCRHQQNGIGSKHAWHAPLRDRRWLRHHRRFIPASYEHARRRQLTYLQRNFWPKIAHTHVATVPTMAPKGCKDDCRR